MDEEPDYQKSYRDWSVARTPAATSKLLGELDPVIGRGVATFGGGKDDPLIRSRARRITLGAIHSYDPNAGTRLTTHVNNNLQGLRRVARQQQQILRTPERVSMDQAYLHRSTSELTDQLGREPSTAELADYAKISVRKIARLRRYMPGMAEGSLDEMSDVPFSTKQNPEAHVRRLAMALHGDLDARDQKILELSLGLFGNRQLQNTEVAQRLGVSPGAISQRKALIQQKLDQLVDGL